MRPTLRTTTWPRIALAIVFAFILPSILLGWIWALSEDQAQGLTLSVLPIGLPAIVFGVFWGWPFVLGAVAVWGVLDQFDRHYPWTAALVGLASGVAVLTLTVLPTHLLSRQLACLACPLLGVITGMGVWWIAYGRQHRLPKSILTRPQLSL
jgi:hypothetical protein